MSDNLKFSEPIKHLLKLPPLLLYEVASDIQVSEKWKRFAFAIGFSTENVIMIEMTNTDRFPAENVMYHWYSRNPKVDELAKVLVDLDLERPFYRLKDYMNPDSFRRFERRLSSNRPRLMTRENNLDFCQETETNSIPGNRLQFQTQMSNASSNSNSSIPTTPEAGLVSISRCIASEDSKSEPLLINKSEPTVDQPSIFEKLLNCRSTKYFSDEFQDELFERTIQGKFGAEFYKTLRGNEFLIKSYCLQKVSESKKNQKKLYSNIWALTNFRLYSIPLITGYCFYENYLFLIQPDCLAKSLFDILHRPEKNNYLISLKKRLLILQSVAKVLSFLHCSIPFGACHGNVISENVLVGTNVILLSGFDKFYTEDPQYLEDLNQIQKDNIQKAKLKIEDFYQLDIKNYLELICETIWNIPNKKYLNNDSLINEITNSTSVVKVKYEGWNEDIEMAAQNIIRRFSTASKEFPKVEEIADELMTIDRPSNEPPSYNEIENVDLITSFK